MSPRHRLAAAVGFAGILAAAGCTSGAKESASTTVKAAETTVAPAATTTASTAAPAATDAPETTVADTVAPTEAPETTAADPFAGVTGDAPGVTDTSVKIGVGYVDFEALAKTGLAFKIGDVKGAWQAEADAINAAGGINGRKIELVFAAIDPSSPAPAEEACVKLTEDDDVFIQTGFFLGDKVLCPVSVHSTAVIGGNISPDFLAQAKAPWISNEADADVPKAIIKAFADAGELKGKVGVYANVIDQAALDTQILPALKDAGVTPVEVGVNDAPTEDNNATKAQVQVLSQRYQAAGVDTLLLVGGSGSQWPTNTVGDTYHPKLLFTADNAVTAFSSNTAVADSDKAVIDGALVGGLYGPEQPKYDEAEMQKCISILTKAGFDIPAPDASDDPNEQRYQPAFLSCPQMALIKAWLTAAGKTLNYGTLDAALKAGFKAIVPGDPKERTYGPGTATDGDPSAYLFQYDAATKGLVLKK